MPAEVILGIAALAVFGYGLVSAVAERLWVTPAVAAVALGAAIGFGLEAVGVGTAAERRALLDGGGLAVLAELALAILLFVDAAGLRLPTLKREAALPVRLLGLGLPALILLGWGLAWLVWPAAGPAATLMLALMLAPTDAALSQPIFRNRATPAALRDGINVESGLNDGMVLPVLLAVVAALGHGEAGLAGLGWLAEAAGEIALGALAGAAIGWAGGQLANRAAAAGRMETRFERLAGIALAIVAFAGAETAGGNGFVGTFVAGLTLNLSRPDLERRMEDFGEAESTLLAMLTFLAFGALVLPSAVPLWDLAALGYAVATLAVLRPLAVGLALLGTTASAAERLYAGWFGPRGIATVLYLLLALNAIGWGGQAELFAVVALTVTLSVVAHGATAGPFSTRLAARLARTGASADGAADPARPGRRPGRSGPPPAGS